MDSVASGNNGQKGISNDIEVKVRPTVVIGLGGSGGEVLLGLRKRFYERYGDLKQFPIISYVWIDTDTGGAASIGSQIRANVEFGEVEKVMATVGDTAAITDNWHAYPGIERWWYPGLNSMGSVTAGAGQIRPYSRMAFFLNYENIKKAIVAAHSRVTDVTVKPKMLNASGFKAVDFDFGKTEVVIVSSVAGGTGAGMLLDVAFLVKELFPTAIVSGHLVLPGNFAAVTVGNQRMMANGYAVLKELDHYQYGNHRFEAYWDNKIHPVPLPAFSYTYLYDGVNCNNMSSGEPQVLYEMLADSLFKDYTHGAFGDKKRSVRVNFSKDLNSVWTMNLAEFKQVFTQRYLSSGFSSIAVPHDRIKMACAYRLAAEVVDSWGESSSTVTTNQEVRDWCLRGMEKLKLWDVKTLDSAAKYGATGKDAGARRDIVYALFDPEAGADVSRGKTRGMVAAILEEGQTLLQDILNGSTPNGMPSNKYIENSVARHDAELIAQGNDPKLWKNYPRTVRDNGNNVLQRLQGQGVGLSLQNWAVDLVEAQGLSLGMVRDVISVLADELRKLKVGYGNTARRCAELSATKLAAFKADYKTLEHAYTGTLVLKRDEVKREYVERCIEDAYGSRGNEGYIGLRVLELVFREAVRILDEAVKYLVGYKGTANEHHMGLCDEFSFADDAVIELSRRLRARGEHFQKAESYSHSLVLYKAEDFPAIYAHYVPEKSNRQGNDPVSWVARTVLQQPNMGVLNLRKAVMSNDLVSWETALVKAAHEKFADVGRDYHVLRLLVEKCGDPEWKKQLGTYVQLSGFRCQAVPDGNAFRLSTEQIGKYVAIPMVRSDDLALQALRESVKSEISSIDADIKVVDVEDSSEILFYQEAGGFPLNYISGLPDMRHEYLKLYGQGKELHMDRADHVYRDPAILTAEEQKKIVEARRGCVFGIGLGILRFKDGQYVYVDRAHIPPLPCSMGKANQALSALVSDDVLRKKVVDEVNEVIDNMYLHDPRDVKFFGKWYSFLSLIGRDAYGDKWGKVKSCLELDFSSAMEVQLIEKEKENAQVNIQGRCGDDVWQEVVKLAGATCNTVAACEEKFAHVDTASNPFPKRAGDGKRVLPQYMLTSNTANDGSRPAEDVTRDRAMEPNRGAVCPKCGSVWVRDARFCSSCGYSPVVCGTPSVCRSCGASLVEGAKFCASCGAPTSGVAPNPVCARCGMTLNPGAKFCGYCGGPVANGYAPQQMQPMQSMQQMPQMQSMPSQTVGGQAYVQGGYGMANADGQYQSASPGGNATPGFNGTNSGGSVW